MLQNTTVDKLKKCGMLLSSRIDGIYEGIMEIHKITTKIMGVEGIGVITSVGEQNSILERRKEMIEHGFVSEKLNVGAIKEKLDEIREFGRRL